MADKTRKITDKISVVMVGFDDDKADAVADAVARKLAEELSKPKPKS